MVGVVWAYEKGKINACGPDGWNCDAFAGGLASGFLSSGSTLVGSTVSNGIAFLQGARWGNGGFRQQLGTHTTEVDGKETTTTMISSRDSIMSLSSNMAGNLVKQIIDNKTGIADGYTFNILNSRDLGFKSDVGLFAVTLGGSKGLSAGISSDGLDISSSMWKDFGEGMKYLNKLNELRGDLRNYDDTDPMYKVFKENYLEFVTEDMMNGDIKIMQIMIDNEKDPAKKEELKKQLENMLNFQGGLQNTIFGGGEGLKIDWTAGEYQNNNGTISLDAANLLKSLRVNAGGNIEFDISGAAANTALMGHEWMHDGNNELNILKDDLKKQYPEKTDDEIMEILKTQYKDKYEAVLNEETAATIFGCTILKGLMAQFGSGILNQDSKVALDFLFYLLADGMNPEEAKEFMKQYIGATHDISNDNFKLLYDKDLKSLVLEIEKGDTIDALWEQLSLYVFGKDSNIGYEEFKRFIESLRLLEGKINSDGTLKEGQKIDIFELLKRAAEYENWRNNEFNKNILNLPTQLDELKILNKYVTNLAIYSMMNMINPKSGTIHGFANGISIMQMEALERKITNFNSLGWYMDNNNKEFFAAIQELTKGDKGCVYAYAMMCMNCDAIASAPSKIQSLMINEFLKQAGKLGASFVESVISIIDPKASIFNFLLGSVLNGRDLFSGSDSSTTDEQKMILIFKILGDMAIEGSDNLPHGFSFFGFFTDLLETMIFPKKITKDEVLKNPLLAIMYSKSFVNLIINMENNKEDTTDFIKKVITPENLKILFYSNLNGFVDIMKMIYLSNPVYYAQLCGYLGFDTDYVTGILDSYK